MDRLLLRSSTFIHDLSFLQRLHHRVFHDIEFKYGGYNKIKHFACHRDFFVHEIPRIKNMQNVSYPGILYPAMEHFAYVLYVGFHAPRYLCDKQNVLFYGHPRISRSQFDQPWSKNGHEFKTKLKCSRKATPHFNLWPNEFILFFRFFTNLSKMRNIKIFSQKRFSPYLEPKFTDQKFSKKFKKFIQFFRWTWDFWQTRSKKMGTHSPCSNTSCFWAFWWSFSGKIFVHIFTRNPNNKIFRQNIW